MTVQTQYAPGEIARRGKEIYTGHLRVELEPGNFGKYLAINIETGEWEIGNDHAETVLHAHAKYPDSGIYGMRIGHLATEALGGGLRRRSVVENEESKPL